jgi:hypothetical protein
MATQEIKDTNWREFCERFEEAHRGTLVSLDVVYHDGATAMLAKNEPLRTFRFDGSAGCSNVIQMELGGAGQITQHEIVEPIHVRLRETAGAQKILEIDAESGSVEIYFSSGRLGAISKDLGIDSPEDMAKSGGRTVNR